MKPYKTKAELINHLEVDRHLRLEEEHKIFLDEYRYGHVIDAYKDILASSVLTGKIHVYNEKITLKTFTDLFSIDEYFSIKLTLYISNYEKMLKKFISDKVCESMVAAGSIDCCDYSFFEKAKEDAFHSYLNCFIPLNKEYDVHANEVLRRENTYNNRIRVINKILGFISGENSSELNYYASDYFNEKGVIPFYILIGSLSISNLIIIFEMLNKSIQFEFLSKVIRKNHIDDKDITSLMLKHNVIRIIRNIIHHHEPLIPFLCKREYIDFDTKISSIKILSSVYAKSCIKGKIVIKSDLDFSFINGLTSKKAQKLIRIVDLLK